MTKFFNRLASIVATMAGSWQAFVLSAALVLGWAITGPMFHFSSTWQLFINTATTVITYLMVFLIQNEQNRNDEALQLKLDEIILVLSEADDRFIGIEELEENAREDLREKIQRRKDSGLED